MCRRFFLFKETSQIQISFALRFLRLLLVLAGCLHLCGGHYGVMQMIAWGNMLVDYSSEKGLVAGVKDTFDGQHPCDLCSSIQAAKQQESKSGEAPARAEFNKFELKNLFPTETLIAKTPRSSAYTLPTFVAANSLLTRFRQSPETPPPRVA